MASATTRACDRHMRAGQRTSLSIGETAILVGIVAVLFAAAAWPAVQAKAPAPTTSTTTVRVGPADTLWSIAARNPIPGMDTAQTVAEIERLNDLTGSNLTEGIALRIPTTRGMTMTALAGP